MNIKIKKRKFFDASETAALSDLGFLLIIYFIVIAGFNINIGFIMNLPQKNSMKIVNVEDVMKIYLMNDSEIIVNEKNVSLEELKDLIKEKAEARPNMTILLKINEEVRYQKVVDFINLAKELKIDNFSFSMIKDKK